MNEIKKGNTIYKSEELSNQNENVNKIYPEDRDSSDSIINLNVKDIPNSSFNVIIARRRGGKTTIIEYLLKEMRKEKMLDCAFLFSPTDSGFDMIDKSCRFKTIDNLHTILENYRLFNEYNKEQTRVRDKIRIRTALIIDDNAVSLKSKEFRILEELAILGRHKALAPLSLHFFVLSQSLTKVPRVVRLNTDHLFLNQMSSSVELEMILQENFYILDASRQGKVKGRDLYNSLVTKEDYQFIVVANYKQNSRSFKDYVFKYKAVM